MFNVNEMSRGSITMVRALSKALRICLVSVDTISFDASRSIRRMVDIACTRIERLIILINGARARLRKSFEDGFSPCFKLERTRRDIRITEWNKNP